MREVRGASVTRIVVVLITAVAWFFTLNHCVLAQIKTAPIAKTSCHQPCCGAQLPVNTKSESAAECCKTLRATLPGAANGFLGYDSSLFAVQLYFIAPLVSPGRSGLTPALELDTGPPFADTFAESVLQRSILAHAPPRLA